MNDDLWINQNGAALIGLDSVVDSLSTFIEQGTETILLIMNSDEFKDALVGVKEIGSELSTAVKVVKVVHKCASIPDKIFMHKVEQYCAGLFSIPVEKRMGYAKRVGKKSLNKDSVFILGILNKMEELSKLDIFLKLFNAKIDEIIDDQTYRRMMLQVDRTMFSDILFLKDNICNEDIEITSVEQENLVATGWLFFSGISWGTATEEGGNLYSYTKTAKQFCNIVFQRNIMITDRAVPVIGTIKFD